MAKTKKYYVCSVCGQQEPQWQGRCHGCGSWNSFEEGLSSSEGRASTGIKGREPGHDKAEVLSALRVPELKRLSSGFAELDRVLGGGLVPGSVIMLGGEPGIGKSTLLLQLAARLATKNIGVLYVSAEESALQVKTRAQRLGCAESNFELLCSNHLSTVVAEVHSKAQKELGSELQLLIVDSLQTIVEPSVGSVPGTPSQLRHITQVLLDCCREYKLTLLLVAHLTKEGVIAGPRTVEHMVDGVIYFESGEHDLRILQANKNRFGSTSEIGILEMGELGLRELPNAQEYFLSQREGELPAGIAIAPVHEGSRSLLVEVQALTVPAKGSVSRIFADRLDNARVSRLAAVLERHTGVIFSDQDIYINVAGGLRLQDIALDLPLALALLSARLARPLPQNLTSAAELSLAGELRPIKYEEQRLRSAADAAMQRLILPRSFAKTSAKKQGQEGQEDQEDQGEKAELEAFRQDPKPNPKQSSKLSPKILRIAKIEEILPELFP